jgi:hypothetical protein
MTTTLTAVHGRILDLDSHLQVPISRWGEVFGDATARFGKRFAGIPLFDAQARDCASNHQLLNL